MVTAAPSSSRLRVLRAPARPVVPPLMNGDHLTTPEFLRRAEAMPELKKVELIEGTVYMPPPLSAESHAAPDGVLQLWLGTYAASHPFLENYTNPTLLLDQENTCQPDGVLCTAPRPGGRVWLNPKGYLCGTPELVCEVAASSASIDLHRKLHAYRRCGVQEYLVWTTLEKRVRWFQLVQGEYLEFKARAGRLESVVFPGLILDVKALLKMDRRGVINALRPPARKAPRRKP